MSRIDEIRHRLAASTPPPWTLRYRHMGGAIISADAGPVLSIVSAETEADLELVVHAPEDLRWALGEVDATKTENNRLKYTVGRLVDLLHSSAHGDQRLVMAKAIASLDLTWDDAIEHEGK